MHSTNTKISYRALCLISILLLSACGGGGGSSSNSAALGASTASYAYVANFGTSSVSQYSVGADGALTLKATVAAVAGPTSVTTDPAGKYVYVANSLDDVISQYKIVAGTLTQMSPATEPSGLAAGSAPVSVAIEPSGKYAYAANSGSDDVTQFSIDATTGALTNLATYAAGKVPTFVTVATVPGGNKYAYVLNAGIPSCVLPCVAVAPSISQYSIHATTGVLTPMATVNLALGTDPVSITVDPAGKYAYVANYTNNTISQYTIAAGLLTPMTPAKVGGGATLLSLPTSIAIDPSGTYAYVSNGSGAYQYSITASGISSGGLVELATPSITTGGFTQRSVAVDPSGKYVYVANQASDSIAQFDIGTGGALTAITPSLVTSAVNSQPFSITTAVAP